MRYATFGNITDYIDLPQVAFWVFFLFFVGLCYWLRMQDKREGYPTKQSPFSSVQSNGILPMPDPHTYLTIEDGPVVAPHDQVQIQQNARPLYPFDGTPLSPVGNPLLAGIGPGAWVMRREGPALTEQGEEALQPLRVMHEWSLFKGETDPRGMVVFDRRYNRIGVVREIWIDRGARIMRMLEVDLDAGLSAGPVLVPIYHTVIKERERTVRVTALLAHQFAEVPRPVAPNSITGREEERLNAYFAAGRFYAGSTLTEPPASAPLWGGVL